MSEEFPATNLLLVRHGQARASDGSYDESTPPNALGRLRAARLADSFPTSARPTAVYASLLFRAGETAAPLCQRLGVQAIVEPSLAEFRFPTGSFESIQQRPDLTFWRPEHRGVEGGATPGEFSGHVAAF